ncbi:L-2,4-diaminobutyrate decarboxylase [Aspergillus sclerotioniger CBS 115572]|uniref:L-2,4-diaminobutyrate decarboxylase n=1 Tax=Aspergillus sclerotioniger CBS 115572 TaxID=1450535 RepID=A0A317VLS5_9EURO|nr:L-2,4-diaminobutyrate decarboxylase [Aspergillus sclerotioniger CBS 115572]PWY75296.1 L-2,4-diaminobutyrate decarboxylase [Aspergillus sclerotioniger CBS 115572]
MTSNEGQDQSEERLSQIMLEATSLLTQLLTTNHPAPSDPIVRKLDPHEIQSMQDQVMPDENPGDLVSVFQQAMTVFDYRMRLNHPHCLAYIPASPNIFARLGDLLTSVWNVNAVSWDVSSGPSAVEKAMIAWLGAQLGLPDSVGGCFVSGGSMANMTAIVAARDERLDPMQRANAVIYISDQTHISIMKALHIAGFMDYQVQKIPTDDEFRIDTDILRHTITTDRQSGRVPFLLVANCGSTNTGSIDPIHALADIARDEGIWLHVDGAYGASIALSNKHASLIDGIGRADSVSWDGHKWLFQTYGCGIVLTRHVDSLRRSFAVDAEYISSTLAPQGTTNFYNLGPELSRPARAIPLWLTLKGLGRRRVGEMIDQGFLLARTADTSIRQCRNWIIPAPTVTSIVVFRYAPGGLNKTELDSLNTAISKRLMAENIAAILTTKIRGRTALRICAMNPAVQPKTINDVIRQVDKVAQSEVAKFQRPYTTTVKTVYAHLQEFPSVDILEDFH